LIKREHTRALRAAARSLTPVILRRLRDPLRYESALDRVDGRGDRAELWIHPTPAAELAGPGGLVVHLSDPALTLFTRTPRIVDADTLAFPLNTVRVRERPDRAHRAIGYTSGLVLTAPSGVGDLRVLPVVDVGSEVCAVRSPEALAEGFVLHGVELVGDAGVLRRCAATVLECVPWVTIRGTREFRLRLRMHDARGRPGPTHDTVDDPERVLRVLELAALLRTNARLGVCRGRVAGVEGAELSLEGVGDEVVAGTRCSVELDLFAVSYEGQVRVLAHDGAHARTTLPLFLRRRRRRAEERSLVGEADHVSVSFRNPVTQSEELRRIRDISQGGLRFEVEKEDVLWRGLHLENAALLDRGHRISLGSLEVRARPGSDCRVSFGDSRCAQQEEFAALLTRIRQPDLEIHDGSTFRSQLALYRHVGLLMPYMEDQLAAAGSALDDNWLRAHQSGAIARTLARYEDGEAVASVTATMGWNRSWLGQHLAARKNRSGCTPGTLLLAFLDHVLLRPDCRWMVFFVTEHNEKMNRIHERFAELTGTPDAMARYGAGVWVMQGPVEPIDGVRVRPRKRRDDALIARASARQMGSLVASGLSFDSRIDATQRRYKRLGLRRGREVRIAGTHGRPRIATLTERTSAGLCIPGILNATWMLPLHFVRTPARAPCRRSVHAALADLTLEPDEPNRLVFADPTIDESTFSSLGLSKLTDAYVYVMSRAGLRRYASYLTESYGELNARRPPFTKRHVA